MRIIPLLEELVQTQRTRKNYNGFLAHRFDLEHKRKGKSNPNRGDGYDLGSGSYARVKPDRKDPHMVVKHPHAPSDNMYIDGFDVYIDYIIKHGLQDNIHFPRVYENKRITDKNGSYINKYQIERLVESSALSEKELEAVAEHNFYPHPAKLEHGLLAWMSEKLAKALEKGVLGPIKLDSLREALEIIRRIKSEGSSGLFIDMHDANFMFRRTPHGLQLVITDPLGAI